MTFWWNIDGIKSTSNYYSVEGRRHWKTSNTPSNQTVLYVMDILFGDRLEKKYFGCYFNGWNDLTWKMTLCWLRNASEFKWFFVPGENNINHLSMFSSPKPQAISPNLLSFYSVPMICGLSFNWIWEFLRKSSYNF